MAFILGASSLTRVHYVYVMWAGVTGYGLFTIWRWDWRKIRDGGLSLQRLRPDPILARSPHDPWMVSTPFVLKRNSDDWLMWYLSGIGWKSIEPPVSCYNIEVARFGDGVNWSRDGNHCL